MDHQNNHSHTLRLMNTSDDEDYYQSNFYWVVFSSFTILFSMEVQNIFTHQSHIMWLTFIKVSIYGLTDWLPEWLTSLLKHLVTLKPNKPGNTNNWVQHQCVKRVVKVLFFVFVGCAHYQQLFYVFIVSCKAIYSLQIFFTWNSLNWLKLGCALNLSPETNI